MMISVSLYVHYHSTPPVNRYDITGRKYCRLSFSTGHCITRMDASVSVISV